MSYYEQLATLIHDLRNPLNTISVNAELARLQLQKSQDPQAVMNCLDKIINECQKCSQVLTEVSQPPKESQ
jgi:signal transduction histidine kinase